MAFQNERGLSCQQRFIFGSHRPFSQPATGYSPGPNRRISLHHGAHGQARASRRGPPRPSQFGRQHATLLVGVREEQFGDDLFGPRGDISMASVILAIVSSILLYNREFPLAI